jgi:triacylglycerol esterase/lipase EstA (alpha/beta hydrolase family)
VIELTQNEQTELLRQIPRAEKSYAKPAFSKIRKANGMCKHQPEKAVALYLSAAKELEPYHMQAAWAYKAYQQSLGKGLELIQTHQLWGSSVRSGEHSFQIASHCHTKASQLTDIDTLHYANKYTSSVLTPAIETHGRGVPMTARSAWSVERSKKFPFMSKIGYIYSVTALAHWSDGNSVSFQLIDSRESSQLSANYTTPHAFSQNATKALIYQGLINVLRPEYGIESMSLISFEPIDPKLIPVIFVHGLAATPNLWIKPTYKLLEDPMIRDNYQFYAYFYPTGLPLSHSAAGLKKEIEELHVHLKGHGAGFNGNDMVIIGHSMGGLLTSAITRDYRGAISEIYNKNIDTLTVETMGKKSIIELLETPPLDCVSRAVFVATPHRGSSYADNWIGQLTSHLIDIPKNIVGLDPAHYRQDLTSLGKSIFDIQEGMDGVQRLKYNNPTLKYNLTRPKLENVTYHSIIGDRGWGGKLENSSDGVVKYTSSHLAEVDSELVVPAWHNAQDSSKAQDEMIRILKLHLESQ